MPFMCHHEITLKGLFESQNCICMNEKFMRMMMIHSHHRLKRFQMKIKHKTKTSSTFKAMFIRLLLPTV